MQLRVHGQNIEMTEAIASHVQNRFHEALDRHERRVDDVMIRLEDVNGPRGGVDMKCQATIHLRPRGTVVIQDIREDLYAAISVAADRAKHVVSRKLGQRRDHLHRRTSPLHVSGV